MASLPKGIWIFLRNVSLPRYWNLVISEAVVHRCSAKKVFLKISQNKQENTCSRVYFLIKLAYNFIKKETLEQVFSCEFSEIFKNTYFYKTPLVAASVIWISHDMFRLNLSPLKHHFKVNIKNNIEQLVEFTFS